MDTDLSSRLNYVLRALELFAGYGDREALVRRDHRFTDAGLRIAVMQMAASIHVYGVCPGMAVAVLVERPIEARFCSSRWPAPRLGCRPPSSSSSPCRSPRSAR